MTKRSGQYVQFEPCLFIAGVALPPVTIGECFIYLGNVFNFAMDDRLVKADIETKLQDLLTTTSNLPVCPQSKFKILRLYITAQLGFELKTYNITATWITEHLVSKICNAVRSWLKLPISTCVAEVLALQLKKGGHGIRSLKTTAQILRLGQRIRLKRSGLPEMGDLWYMTSSEFPTIDEFITSSNPDACEPAKKSKD